MREKGLYVIFDLENMRMNCLLYIFLLIEIVGLDAWLIKIVFDIKHNPSLVLIMFVSQVVIG